MESTDFATHTSTIGMGNPSAPRENGEIGSGDTFTPIEKSKKKKLKNLKDYLKKH